MKTFLKVNSLECLCIWSYHSFCLSWHLLYIKYYSIFISIYVYSLTLITNHVWIYSWNMTTSINLILKTTNKVKHNNCIDSRNTLEELINNSIMVNDYTVMKPFKWWFTINWMMWSFSWNETSWLLGIRLYIASPSCENVGFLIWHNFITKVV